MRSKVIPKKVGVGLKQKGLVEQEEIELKISFVRIHRKEEGLKFAWIKSKTPMLSPALQSNLGFLCGLGNKRYQDGEEGRADGQVVSLKRAAEGGRE